ncbi:MAG: radical SAM family heme chaperone HemW [Tissierellia bacterium]|nr:radical SAM family heme chaperone HemW [Tissierellia bacterium]
MEKYGLYIHIPFCKKKCYYCDFCAYQNLEDRIDLYFKDLEKEIELRRKNLDVKIDSIYIGGGTPSYVDPAYIQRIFEKINKFDIDKKSEITIEVNPDSVREDKLKIYKSLGVNRISMGVQSFNDKILEKIGRTHKKEDVLRAFEIFEKLGFKNISIDMMLNLPTQTKKDVLKDLEIIKNLNIKHISWYSLILEKGSYFNSLYEKDKLELMDDDSERDIFKIIIDELNRNGIIRYEISNFAKKGFKSKHNKKYWDLKRYIGVGLSAASYIKDTRMTNTRNFIAYHKRLQQGQFPIETSQTLTNEDKIKEYIIFKLRETEGINKKEFKDRFGFDLMDKYKEVFSKYKKLGFFEEIGDNISFTEKGMDLSNSFYVDII